MGKQVLAVVVWVALVAALAGYVATSGPAANDVVYRYHTAVDAAVEVTDPAFDVTVAGVASGQLEDIQLWGWPTAAVVVTVTPTNDANTPSIAIDSDAATVTGRDDYTVQTTTVQGDQRLTAGLPTVVRLAVEQPVEVEGGFTIVATTLTAPVEVRVPILVSDQQIATVTAQLSPVAVTGDDLGIPGTVDIPDQRLPKPAAGEALPTQLDDGRPVWVVGLDDTVTVLDARSPHRYSGLVGWCGSMPGFIDSIGSSRFTATGEYRFGPAPRGLTPYAVDVADDHVIATHRLPHPPRPHTPSAVEEGPYCNGTDQAAQAGDDGYLLEDYSGNPSWVQHDLAGWPELDGARQDGWFRTDEHDLGDGGPHLVGDLLVQRERGVIVDAASPPGTARTLYPSPTEPTTLTGRHAQLDRTDGSITAIAIQPVMWVTPSGVFPVDNPPDDHDRHLAPTAPASAHQLADGVVVPGQPGDVVTLTIVNQEVTNITALEIAPPS